MQRQISSNQKPEKIGDISFEFEQNLADGGDIKFKFEQDIEASKDIQFHFEKKSIQGGRIKFQYEQHFDQQMDRHGSIKFQYNNQTNATVKNTGHGTMQVIQHQPCFETCKAAVLLYVQYIMQLLVLLQNCKVSNHVVSLYGS